MKIAWKDILEIVRIILTLYFQGQSLQKFVVARR